ncbi:hypothetical protein COW20_15325 [bacterium (Candidatus Blackallbacteria) CG13_big_fil_rev_8_21_14_2_50_49_14]|nr:MAG: hypothetical protein COW64_15165 [bacterium (Candidatus Blackallbacteria) CG18_big_fil_WC_8_21_14_2_50_49_26]PIW46658.1 MAG: hypothetical protein COW20_15325 [bacterium (Candidatus Blackallbacteria) CG13_big_fil_rev_8_21_14_2_50_49_14]
MEKQVIYRDRQELQAADLLNTQTWLDEGQQHLLMDAVTSERQFIGLTTTARTATELDIAQGRLYDGTTGKVYFLAATQTVSVFSMLPLQDQKWLAVSVYGQEEDTDIQPRDFLIDLQTGQTQPEAVAMQKRRVVISHIAQGLESPTPEKPSPPTGYTLIAHVRLSPSGIQEVILASTFNLPNLQDLSTRMKTAEGWITSAEPRIAHIISDIAGLGEAVAARATIQQALQLAMDMARVKERLEIPDAYVFYGADHFLNEDESDTGAVGYSARLQEGVRPVIAAQDTVSFSLLNPVDPAAKLSTDNFLLPAYNEITRLRMETQVGELTINQYQYQTTSMIQRTMSRERIQYGETRTLCTNSGFWRSGIYDPMTGIYRINGETWTVDPAYRQNMILQVGQVRATQFWYTTYAETYWDAITSTHTVQGSILAQTVLMAQTGWMTSIDVYFTSVDTAGGLTLILTDASQGQPDLNHGIAKLDLAANALSAGWTRITFPRPVFVESGRRYAIVLVSGAQHRVGFTQGTDYTQGVLMYAQDGAYFNEAADRDLMLRLQFAQFTTPRSVIQMQPLQLAGGIGDLDLLYEGVTPDGTQIFWEYQVGGIWYPIKAGTAENIATLPALLPVRAVFVGTTDLMPGLQLSTSQVIVSRIGTSFTHYSTARALGSPSSHVIVRLLLEDFDPLVHTAGCQLVIGGTPVAATSSRDEIVDTRSRWREYDFTLGAPTSAYSIEITGSTTSWRQSWHVAERYDLAL